MKRYGGTLDQKASVGLKPSTPCRLRKSTKSRDVVKPRIAWSSAVVPRIEHYEVKSLHLKVLV